MASDIYNLGILTNIRVKRGNTFIATVSATADGEAYTPQEGDVFTFSVRPSRYTAPVIVKAVPLDTMLLTLDQADTATLPTGTYWHDVTLTKAGGDADTFIRGKFIVEA